MARRRKNPNERRPEPRPVRRVLWVTGFVLASGLVIWTWTGEASSPPSVVAAPAPVPSTVRKYLSPEQQLGLPDAEIDYGVAALVVTRDYVPGYDVASGLKKLDEITARVRALLAQQADADDPMIRIAAINTVLYREYQFSYDTADFPKRSENKRLLGNLLRRGQGTCANMPDLYYAVAERLGFPIYMVEAPQHVFLRYVLPNGEHINIEATGGGGQSPDADYIAEMEIPKAALDSGTFMRTLSRKEALHLLIAERTFFDEMQGNFERVLAEAKLLRELRPNHAGTFWNSAVFEVIAGRATRELARTDPAFGPAAEASFATARAYAKRAMELGIMKPDDTGEWAKRQEAIRLKRLGETVTTFPPLERFDALAELERIIAAPPGSELDTVTAFRKPNPLVPMPRRLDAATEKELAVLREVAEVERYNAQQQARTDALIEALQRQSMAPKHEDRMKALDDVTRLLGAPRQVANEPPPSSRLGAHP